MTPALRSPVQITPHGLLFAAGALLAAVLYVRGARRFGVAPARSAERAAWIYAAGLVGARVAFVLAYPSNFGSLADAAAYWRGGLVSFGGILFGGLAAAAAQRGEPSRAALARLLVSAVAAGWAVGRVGNWLQGESGGSLPIQLFEAAGCLAIAVAVPRVRLADAGAAWWGGCAYFVLRFFLDFWRDEGRVGPFGWSQATCLAVLPPLILMYHHARAPAAPAA